ncbi:MAG: ATPase, T2SS/T4P/T4SS family [Clostridiaceae bacterium]|nr:ATPase, T2SS/T4P/T4SS family [Clostridiaceae bacterium]
MDGLNDLVIQICSKILDTDPELVARVAARQTPRQVLLDLVGRTAGQLSLRAGFFENDIRQQVMDYLFGYGPLQPYIDRDAVTDIDGTGPGEFTIKADGIRQEIDLRFADKQAYDAFCRLVIIRNGGIINENDSHCRVSDPDYRLRINVTVPPRSVNCPTISIRKHRKQTWDLSDLVKMGMLVPDLADMIRLWACSGQTVLICGKGAAGKTTLLRAFIQAMPRLERVLIAESDCELYPEKPCCLMQRVKKAHEGGRSITLRDLINDGLTMSLDSYCIGEIVGDEAMEFLRAAFSGHRCLATIHAERASDVPDRMLALARPASHGESDRTLKRMLGSSIDIIIYLHDFRVMQVLAVKGYREGDDEFDFDEIWHAEENQAAILAISQYALPMVPGS